MALFKWERGRQANTLYHKYCFLYWRIFNIGMDGYLLKYPPKTYLPPHRDVVAFGNHYRLNIIFGGSKYDEFRSERVLLNIFNRIILFRPDVSEHSVLTFHKERWVLSLGIVKFRRKTWK